LKTTNILIYRLVEVDFAELNAEFDTCYWEAFFYPQIAVNADAAGGFYIF
jgi:hypothetical protein